MPTNSSDHLLKSLKNNSLIRHTLQPTRIRDNQSQNILDLLITNGDIIDNIEFNDPIGHSDHVVLKFNYAFMDNIDYYSNPIFCCDKGDYDKLRTFVQTELQNLSINNESVVNYIWNQMKLIIQEGVKKYVPTVRTTSNSKKFHKIGDDLKKDIKRKHRLWTRYRETNKKAVEKSYKELKNNIKNKIKKIIQGEYRI